MQKTLLLENHDDTYLLNRSCECFLVFMYVVEVNLSGVGCILGPAKISRQIDRLHQNSIPTTRFAYFRIK